ncbi:nuclease domain-containing protein [Sinobaca qinghaiensis]|nr:nuclease domain-containing protein [Sinobaca qinghaiensis]
MEIKPVMINVHYDMNAELYERTLPVKNIEEVNKIHFDYINNCWYTFNHYKNYSSIKGEITYGQIGFKVIKQDQEKISGETIYLKNDEGIEKKLFFDEVTNIWFELSKFKINKQKKLLEYSSEKRDQIAGLNQAGNLTPILKSSSGQTIQEGKTVLFLPSSISIDDYQIMVAEIFKVYIDLLRDRHSKVKVGKQQTKALDWIKEIVSKIENPINRINREPSENFNIAISNDKVHHNETRYNPAVEIQKRMFLGKDKVRRPIIYREINTYENRVIKQFLMSLKFYVDLYLNEKLIKTKKLSIESELNILKEKSNFLKDFNDNDLQELSEESVQSDKEFKHREEILQKQVRNIICQTKSNKNDTIDIKLEFQVNSTSKSTKYDLYNDQIKTIYSTNWIEKINDWNLYLISYSYFNAKNEEITVNANTTAKFSKKFELKINANKVKDHLPLLKYFKKLENSSNTNNFIISGKVQKNANFINNSDVDLVGIDNGNSYKEYNFEFLEMQKILVNQNEIDFSNNDSIIELVRYLLPFDLKYAKELDYYMQNKLKIISYQQQQDLKDQMLNIDSEMKEYEQILKKVSNLLSLKMFEEIEFTKYDSLKPTQLFLHDANYRSVWEVLKLNEYLYTPSIITKNKKNLISITNVNDIYELWSFMKMYLLLTDELGWGTKDKKSLSTQIELFISGRTNKKKKNLDEFKVNLTKTDYTLELCYNPQLPRFNKVTLRPDYRFILKKINDPFSQLTVYLDAKYRNYNEQTEKAWINDIKEVAIEKYLRSNPSEKVLKGDLSFILHCDNEFGAEKEREGTSYSAAYDGRFLSNNENIFLHEKESNYKDIFLTSEEYGHRTGSIYMTPQSTFSFVNWFRMIMEYHIGDYETCWKCGSPQEKVIITESSTEKGYPKYYLECKTCGDFWVKVHCRNGHQLIKHTNNFHQQKKSSNSWYVICPICFNGR